MSEFIILEKMMYGSNMLGYKVRINEPGIAEKPIEIYLDGIQLQSIYNDKNAKFDAKYTQVDYRELAINKVQGMLSIAFDNDYSIDAKLADNYVLKRKALGIPCNLVFTTLTDGTVKLVTVKNTSDKVVEIPSFITSYYVEYKNFSSLSDISSPFIGCNCEKVIIHNKPGIPVFMDRLFSRMNSRKLKIEMDHPECLVGMYMAFYNCFTLEEIDLSSITGENLVFADEAFYGCNNLKHINFGELSSKNIISANRMFDRCGKLEVVEAPNFYISDISFCDGLDSYNIEYKR